MNRTTDRQRRSLPFPSWAAAAAVCLVLFLPTAGWTQTPAADLLGVVPEGAVMAGQVRVGEVLDIDRLEVLLNSWGAVLGDQADELVAQMRQQYDAELAPFANNVEVCITYAESFQNDAPVSFCRGSFGPDGYAPPDLSEVEVVDGRFLVAGRRRAEVTSRLQSDAAGTASVAGVAIDPSLLAHFVVTIPDEMRQQLASQGQGPMALPIDAIRVVEARLTDDPTQLGGFGLEIRVLTDSPEAARQIYNMAVGVMTASMHGSPELQAAGVDVSTLTGWLQVEGNDVVIRPHTETLAVLMAVTIPTFLDYVDQARAAEGIPTPPPSE